MRRKDNPCPFFTGVQKKRPVRRTSFVRIPRRFPFGHSIAVFFFRRPTSRENLRPGGGRTAFLPRRRAPRTLPFQKIKSHLRKNRETRYPRPHVPPVNLFEIKRVSKKDEAAYPSSAKEIVAPPLPKTSASPSAVRFKAPLSFADFPRERTSSARLPGIFCKCSSWSFPAPNNRRVGIYAVNAFMFYLLVSSILSRRKFLFRKENDSLKKSSSPLPCPALICFVALLPRPRRGSCPRFSPSSCVRCPKG